MGLHISPIPTWDGCPHDPVPQSVGGGVTGTLKTYIFDYRFEGKTHGLNIEAASEDEARARVRALPWAQYRGELVAEIPVTPAAAGMVGLIRRIWGRE